MEVNCQDEREPLFLERKVLDRRWLEKSAIGVLREFFSVSRVNKRLSDRGFRFTTRYVGRKAILWDFESVFESEGFINNRFFWDDSFISMEKWTKSLVTQPMPVWVNVSGILLNFWNVAFFQKVGNYLGELLHMDNNTTQKIRIVRGRLLVVLHEE
ncbi:hypothetical protein Dsin_022699 [Dipteronia sinensis]|uniref:DUF4283 domain-containing protein n=1 Tax=Dipteronia sinensis TaxID=43782 RepID=A0AAE0E0B6_9ROSI|nr:hypothetical protein Dsin_022699 [Dipteronia sinensis]